MILKQYYLGCLAHASYLLADEESSTAIIADPQRDIQHYLADAEQLGLEIRHVPLSHFHADFVARHLELRDRCAAAIHLVRLALIARPGCVCPGIRLPLALSPACDKYLLRRIDLRGRSANLQVEVLDLGLAFQAGVEAKPVLVFRRRLDVLKIGLKGDGIARTNPVARASGRLRHFGNQALSFDGAIQGVVHGAVVVPIDGVDDQTRSHRVVHRSLHVGIVWIEMAVVVVDCRR